MGKEDKILTKKLLANILTHPKPNLRASNGVSICEMDLEAQETYYSTLIATSAKVAGGNGEEKRQEYEM